jgi:quercetin dioxygenase-like cupin family protein
MLSARLTQALVAAALLLSFGVLAGGAERASPESVKTVLDTGKTILGQPFTYPTGALAKVMAEIITMKPGEETGWHEHDVPMFVYLLDGELTVDYGPHGKRVYGKGDAAMEAIDTAHNGRNTGHRPVRVLAVFAGADGIPDTKKMAPPKQAADAR